MALRLTRKAREELEAMIRHQCGEARLYRRARIVLLAASGESKSSIARQLGTNRTRVGEWLYRFEQDGVEGLQDYERCGRPKTISTPERHQVIATACRSPREFGIDRTIWTHETLREALISADLVREISTTTLGAVLDEAEIKPHRVKMWCHSNDPDYEKKMRAIVRLYVRRPKGEPVLCIDEKTGMQALSRARDLQPAQAQRDARFEFEYRRNGTRCLFGCFNIGTGRVIGRCTTSRKRDDFFS
ncbi:MAG: IS630 family transposase, partial [Candidatus Eisenbacteria bacterium]|nr:IS630 family transposase [Candidatus Eisenbacteria bacterium]